MSPLFAYDDDFKWLQKVRAALDTEKKVIDGVVVQIVMESQSPFKLANIKLIQNGGALDDPNSKYDLEIISVEKVEDIDLDEGKTKRERVRINIDYDLAWKILTVFRVAISKTEYGMSDRHIVLDGGGWNFHFFALLPDATPINGARYPGVDGDNLKSLAEASLNLSRYIHTAHRSKMNNKEELDELLSSLEKLQLIYAKHFDK